MNHLLRPRIWGPSRRPRVLAPATYRPGTPRNQYPAAARWHAHPLRARCAPLSPASGFPVSSRSLRSAQSRKRVPSFVVSRQQLKLPATSCRESSKCKVLVPLYCSSLALPFRPRRTRGMRSLKHFHEISGLADQRV
jgi:hypothetical protein